MNNLNFRAWHKEKKEMCEVLEIKFVNRTVIIFVNEDLVSANYYKEVILMQSTGLKDSKGVEIFEGDILEIDKQDRCKVIWLGEHDYPAFDLEPNYMDECNALSHLFCGDEAFEVIGNIYEQPELLRDKNQR